MKKNNILLLAICCLCLSALNAQYDDYIGAGHNEGIIVSTSSAASSTSPYNTIDGNGMQAELMEYSRFLTQTTFGSDMEEIERARSMGMDAWLEEQFEMPVANMTDRMWEIWGEIEEVYKSNTELALAFYIYDLCQAHLNDPSIPAPDPLTQEEVDDFIDYYLNDIFGPYSLQFNYTWSDQIINNEDQLRQRVAFALSQIMVISSNSDLGDNAESLTSYYDILLENSFGNFKELLKDITLSPSMGFYLSHLNNSKAIPEENIHPDENYAREIMQLFSIGLYELNADGTRKKDASGNDIPTYNNADIKEMARIFTGLAPGELDPTMIEAMEEIWWPDEAYFGVDYYIMNKTEPLIMYEDFHDQGSKSLLNGLEIPANQGGMADIDMTIDFLYNHPNVGPFIGRQLIQRLVKSNPSPQYIQRVTNVFNDNGSGVRGDLRAVVKAIILDPEARTCENQQFLDNGKLKEPILRLTHLQRTLDYFANVANYNLSLGNYSCAELEFEELEPTRVDDGIKFWNNGFDDFEMIKQYPMMAPSVFNFYTPDHVPVGDMAELELVGPEFKIHDTSTSVNYINLVWKYTNPWYSVPWYNWYSLEGVPSLMNDFTKYEDLYNDDPEKLLNYLDVEFLNGNMSDNLRNALRTYAKELPNWANNTEEQIPSKQIIFLMMISPEYTILK